MKVTNFLMLIVFCGSSLVVSMEQPESSKYWVKIGKSTESPLIGAVKTLQDNVPSTVKSTQRDYIRRLRSACALGEQDKLKAISVAILKERMDILQELLSDNTDVQKIVSDVSLYKEHTGEETEEKVLWPLLCFAVLKKNQEIMSFLINKGACHRDLDVESFNRLMRQRMGDEEIAGWHRLARDLDMQQAQQNELSINSGQERGDSVPLLGCSHDIKRTKTPIGCILQ